MIGLSSQELELELKWFQELELELNRNDCSWKNRNTPIESEYFGRIYWPNIDVLGLLDTGTRLLTNIDRSIPNLRLCDVNVSESDVCSTTSGQWYFSELELELELKWLVSVHKN